MVIPGLARWEQQTPPQSEQTFKRKWLQVVPTQLAQDQYLAQDQDKALKICVRAVVRPRA
jgi:hypothetical protein